MSDGRREVNRSRQGKPRVGREFSVEFIEAGPIKRLIRSWPIALTIVIGIVALVLLFRNAEVFGTSSQNDQPAWISKAMAQAEQNANTQKDPVPIAISPENADLIIKSVIIMWFVMVGLWSFSKTERIIQLADWYIKLVAGVFVGALGSALGVG